ncbi:NADH-ubiquinone oxidoreductase chain 4 [Varanus komodoensis]|nr:NADH-ubiquinone oxidoreductase chain 4 [Varanus komodoensis]
MTFLTPNLLFTLSILGLSFHRTHLISALLCIESIILALFVTIASQNHLKQEPTVRKRTFLITITTLQVFLLLTFTANNLMLLYISFEATLVPTLIIITRWGSQAERLKAGTYFIFYTLASSLPLLISILYLNSFSLTLLIPEIYQNPPITLKTLNGAFL